MKIATKKDFRVIGVGLCILLIVGIDSRIKKELKFETITRYGVSTEKGNMVIKDEVKFKRLWKKWYKVKWYYKVNEYAENEFLKEIVKKLKYPKIDFSKEMVIGVFMGECSSGGYDIEIKRIEKRIGRIMVYVEKRIPYRGVRTAVLTAPAHLVKLERSMEPVIFSYHTIPTVEDRLAEWLDRKYGRILEHLFGL